MLTLRFDGLFREVSGQFEDYQQAGIMCYGWLIQRAGVPIAQGHGAFARGSEASSNIAEYLALIEGLDALQDFASVGESVCVCGDAKSIIDQMRGVSQVNASSVQPIYDRAIKLAARFSIIEWVWLPRKKNHLADSLTRRALRQIRRDRENYDAMVKAITRTNPRKTQPPRLLQMLDLRIYSNARPALTSAPEGLGAD
jgi:ribonuclease HI